MSLVTEGILVFAAMLIVAVIGMFVARRYVPERLRRANREAAEPIWGIAAAAFGLLLGFMVVNLWQDLNEAQDVARDEANGIVAMFRLSQGLPEPARTQVRAPLQEYTRLVTEEEWDLMGQHKSSQRAAAALDTIWSVYHSLEPTVGGSNVSYQGSLEQLLNVQKDRNRRLGTAEDEVPGALWAVVLFGVAVMFVLAWLTGSEEFWTHVLITVTLAISLASILFIIRVLNNPFQGDVRADPLPFEQALQFISQH